MVPGGVAQPDKLRVREKQVQQMKGKAGAKNRRRANGRYKIQGKEAVQMG
jgi:hypothetical protein